MYMCWFGSSLTKQIAGVTVKINEVHLEENPEEWEHAKKWTISNFGFSDVPIYDVTIDGWKERVVKTRKKKDEEQKKGRPTKKSEEERRKRLSEEERKKEDSEREKRRIQRKLREAKKKRLPPEERK